MARVTGIGGVFIRAKGDSKVLANWYKDHLGIDVQPWGGAVFRWQEDEGRDGGATAWNIDAKNSTSYGTSEAAFRINYRVQDLDGLARKLSLAGVHIKGPESSEYGKFAWLQDPEGNQVELWEP